MPKRTPNIRTWFNSAKVLRCFMQTESYTTQTNAETIAAFLTKYKSKQKMLFIECALLKIITKCADIVTILRISL